MPESKVISRSVALSEELWRLVDDHVRQTPATSRSDYFRRLVTDDLNLAGKEVGDENTLIPEILALVKDIGAERAHKKLAEYYRTLEAARS